MKIFEPLYMILNPQQLDKISTKMKRLHSLILLIIQLICFIIRVQMRCLEIQFSIIFM